MVANAPYLPNGNQMPHRSQTGQRIRTLRLGKGLSQQDLARQAGISPSYLNLIEHDRRRISGSVLNEIAGALGVTPAQLTEQMDATLLDRLSGAEQGATEPVETFVDQFPGWARVVAGQAAQIGRLDSRIAALTNRMAHDPLLAGALHQVLSTVTSIRSTASILVEGAGDREWEARFHQNIHGDSLRLAEVSQSLVSYLEGPQEALDMTPEEEAARYFDGRGHHFAELETGTDLDLGGLSEAAQRVAGAWLARYRADAERMPIGPFAAAAAEAGYRPEPLVQAFAAPPAAVMRRLATLPAQSGQPAMGLAICDGAGVLTYLKRIEGFDMPPVGGACSLWPLFGALGQLGRPITRVVAMPGTQAPRLTAYAIADPKGLTSFEAAAPVEAVMLVVADAPGGVAQPVGRTCALCPRQDCAARRGAALVPGVTAL